MTSRTRHERISELLLQAWNLPAEERAAFLDAACGSDLDLRAEVENLLLQDAHGTQEQPLGQPAAMLRETWPDALHAWENAHQPERLGQFRILGEIGRGGMGCVYRAEQARPQRTVALKLIRPGFISENALRRFEHEVEILGRLKHPGIAQIFDAGVADTGFGPQPYFAMELINGHTLLEHASTNRLDSRQRLEVVTGICDAVQHAHHKGVIHRDLKPANILVDETGQPKVLDFGVARATDVDMQISSLHSEVGQLIGTIPYMSPEQAAGNVNDLDTRSDVYSLGVILYELLTQRLPYELLDKPAIEAARIVREDDPVRPSTVSKSLAGDLETIMLKAIEKDRTRRYQTAFDLAADLRRYLRDEPIIARPASAVYRLRKFVRRHVRRDKPAWSSE